MTIIVNTAVRTSCIAPLCAIIMTLHILLLVPRHLPLALLSLGCLSHLGRLISVLSLKLLILRLYRLSKIQVWNHFVGISSCLCLFIAICLIKTYHWIHFMGYDYLKIIALFILRDLCWVGHLSIHRPPCTFNHSLLDFLVDILAVLADWIQRI